MTYKRTWLSLLLPLLLLVFSNHPGFASQTSRGLTVTLKDSERSNAKDAGSVQLYGSSYALVVGIDGYNAGWPRLSNAIKDAELIGKALEKRGFEVTFAIDLDSDELEDAFETFFIEKGADPEARLFVWYAGHGHTENGEGFLVPADAPLPSVGAKFRRKALSMRRFGEYVRLAESKHAFAVFDSCFAGTIFEGARSAPPPAITRATTLPARQFLSSGDADQEVSDDGTFRRLFLEALEGSRPADANRDGYLTASEIGLFLSDSVSNYSNNFQTPRYGSLRDPRYDRGDFVFQLASLTTGDVAAATSSSQQASDQSTRSLELAFWSTIKDSNDPGAYQAYLDQFPNGTFAPLAELRIKETKKRTVASADQNQTASLPSKAQQDYKIKALLDTRFMLKSARVHNAPDDAAATIGKLLSGSEVTVTGEVIGSRWYRVAMDDGREGFVERNRVSGPFVAEKSNTQQGSNSGQNAEESSGSGGGGLFSLFGLGGGISIGNSGSARAPTHLATDGSYDGHWKGHATLETGRCKVRFFLDFRVNSGRVQGQMIITDDQTVPLTGTVDTVGGMDLAANHWSVTSFDGHVNGNSVNGKWRTPPVSAQNPGCSGSFNIARVGN